MSKYVNVCSIICLAPQTEFDHDPLDKTYSDVISMLSFGARLSYILYLSDYYVYSNVTDINVSLCMLMSSSAKE
jgi:hypothetical protein